MLERLRRLFLSPRLMRFALVGFSGVFVNLACLALFADVLELDALLNARLRSGDSLSLLGKLSVWLLETPHVISSAAAIEVSVIWNFLLNNAWTFKDRNEGARSGFMARLLKYHLVSLVGMGLQLGCFVAANAIIMGMLNLGELGLWKYLSQLFGIAFAMAWNFLSNFYFTWRQDETA